MSLKIIFTICLQFIHNLHICNSQTLNIIYLSNETKTFDKCLDFFIPSPLRNASPGVSFFVWKIINGSPVSYLAASIYFIYV